MAMVGEKDQCALVLLIPELDAAQEQAALAGARRLVKEDDLIALDAAALGNRPPLQNAVVGVLLHAGDEEDAVLVEGAKFSV